MRFIVAVALLVKYLSNDPFASNLYVLDPPLSLSLSLSPLLSSGNSFPLNRRSVCCPVCRCLQSRFVRLACRFFPPKGTQKWSLKRETECFTAPGAGDVGLARVLSTATLVSQSVRLGGNKEGGRGEGS